jgi:hypothetical protein
MPRVKIWHESQIKLHWSNSSRAVEGHFVGSASKGLGCNDLEEIDSTGLLSISLM